MSVRRVVAAAAAAGVLAGVTSGCGGGSSSSAGGSGPGPTPATSTSETPSSPTTSPTPVGSPEHPVAVPAQQDVLDWAPVPGSTKDAVTVGGRWTLTVLSGGGSARLDGPHPRTIQAGPHASITDAYLDGSHALVVSEDRLAQDPDVATVVDLRTGRATTLDRSSTPPTVVGGTWALGTDSLLHATSGPHHTYCVATVDLTTGRGTTGWCAPPRHGFSRASVNGSAATMMVFDDHHPSCRTLVQVGSDAHLTPIPGVTHCKGWDSSLTAPGAVWSVVPKEHRIEAAHFYAHTAAGWFDLGPGISGSLVTCAGDSYFARDPASGSDPATLLRWSPDQATLSVVFSSTGTGNAFLAPPRCGGDHLTVTAYSQAGDEQVTTRVG
ncbi:MAG TPA: hypothetical protein VHR35_08280 [Nocardioides sp.]|nr:hypothetical protein [Nocardioides sp.]